jgi:hypothetical protein
LTNKNHFEAQIAKRTLISEHIRIVDSRVSKILEAPLPRKKATSSNRKEDKKSTPGPRHHEPFNDSLRMRYHIADDETHHVKFADFVDRYQQDSAMQVEFQPVIDYLSRLLIQSSRTLDWAF